MKIALIDYGMGNLRNVERAFTAVGGEVCRVENGEMLQTYNAMILPGVGHFGDGMHHLQNRGFVSVIQEKVALGVPLFGICLGMQMLFEASEEAPDVAGLGLFKGRVVRFPRETAQKVPHMGWNTVCRVRDVPLQAPFPDNAYFYFVHTYHVQPEDARVVTAVTDYIHPFPAAVGRDNIFATQFHPEKSQDVGLSLIKHFIDTLSVK